MKNLIQGNKPPRADTCNECDKYKAEMKNFRRSNDRSEERLKAISDMKSKNKVHLRRSKVPHTWRKEYRKCTDPGVACITVDLQKTLPTPKINTCLQYYKRKLWTYNLCIHDVKTGHASMYLWDESIAKRGSVEIASCMLHYIENEIKPEVTKLVVFSDNCGGQNKNWTLMCMYLRQIHANRFTRVEHILGLQVIHTCPVIGILVISTGLFGIRKYTIKTTMLVVSDLHEQQSHLLLCKCNVNNLLMLTA